MLHELIYTSFATIEMDENELADLLELSREKNVRLNISGLLVSYKREFIQLLEGERSDIFSLYETICKDERNQQNQLLWDGKIEERSFTDWSMAFLNVKDIDKSKLKAYSTFLQEGVPSLHFTGNKSMGRRLLMDMKDEFL
jgi:hypothetical protein